MTFFQILDSLLLQPLQLLFEVVYVNANRVIGNPGLSIIVLSLVMNFLVLPLYMRADALQEEERDMEARLHRGVTHIKKTFRGDEKMMILQTYYRQNHYKPTYVLRSAVSLFLEIPFFIAAYRFLSGLELIKGVSFGPIADLGAADGLIAIAGVHINLLPIIMTAVNLVSCIIFTKGATPKTKIQLYVMAVFFLFFLYTSPAGLVFYWTLNNIFSLIKTIFYKLKHPGRVLKILAAVAGAALLALGLVRYSFSERPVVKAALLLLGAALMLPLIVGLIRTKKPAAGKPAAKPNAKIFFGCAAFLALFIGVSAILAVTTRRILRAATYLLFVLFGTAGIYFQLNYSFLGAVQLLIYAGGITVLYVFSILLTSRQGGKAEDLKGYKLFVGLGAALASLGICLWITLRHDFLPSHFEHGELHVRTIGHALMSSGKYGYILPFEVISLLLLACIVGGILIARKR